LIFINSRTIYKIFKIKTDKKNLDFKFIIEEDVPRLVVSDKTKIKQIIINLVGNALKFTKYGAITVKFKNDSTNNRLVIFVEDTGIGISKEELNRIFNPFEQTRTGRMAGGAGLGLSISKKYSELLGGGIKVESILGEGTTFEFSFEYQAGCETDLTNEAPLMPVMKIKDDKEVKVLIVDDRDNNRDILTKMLKPLGFITKEADDGYKAIYYINDWKPDIILLDIIMPIMSGTEVIKRMKSDENAKNIKIIVITASVLDDDKKNIMEIGADSFIRKPFKQNVILEEIRKLLGLEYVYRAEIKQNNEPKNDISEENIKKVLSSLPEDFIEKFKQKLIIGDVKEVNKLNDFIESHNKKICEYFKKLIEDYDFNVVLSYLKNL